MADERCLIFERTDVLCTGDLVKTSERPEPSTDLKLEYSGRCSERHVNAILINPEMDVFSHDVNLHSFFSIFAPELDDICWLDENGYSNFRSWGLCQMRTFE